MLILNSKSYILIAVKFPRIYYQEVNTIVVLNVHQKSQQSCAQEEDGKWWSQVFGAQYHRLQPKGSMYSILTLTESLWRIEAGTFSFFERAKHAFSSLSATTHNYNPSLHRLGRDEAKNPSPLCPSINFSQVYLYVFVTFKVWLMRSMHNYI